MGLFFLRSVPTFQLSYRKAEDGIELSSIKDVNIEVQGASQNENLGWCVVLTINNQNRDCPLFYTGKRLVTQVEIEGKLKYVYL